jgi:hypothetical protein
MQRLTQAVNGYEAPAAPARDERGKFVPARNTGGRGSARPAQANTRRARSLIARAPEPAQDEEDGKDEDTSAEEEAATVEIQATAEPATGTAPKAPRKDPRPARVNVNVQEECKAKAKNGPCSDCGHPFHRWDRCPRNKASPQHTPAAARHAGTAKLYDGKWDDQGRPTFALERAAVRQMRAKLGASATRSLRVDMAGRREITAQGYINGGFCPGMVLDTGAQISVINNTCYQRLSHRIPVPQLRNSTPLVEVGDGAPVRILGAVSVRLELVDPKDGQRHARSVEMLVADHIATDVLLGLDLLPLFLHSIVLRTGELCFHFSADDAACSSLSCAQTTTASAEGTSLLLKLGDPLLMRPGEETLVKVLADVGTAATVKPVQRYLIEAQSEEGGVRLNFDPVLVQLHQPTAQIPIHVVNTHPVPLHFAAGTTVGRAVPLPPGAIRPLSTPPQQRRSIQRKYPALLEQHSVHRLLQLREWFNAGMDEIADALHTQGSVEQRPGVEVTPTSSASAGGVRAHL